METTDLWELPSRLRTLIEGELQDAEKIAWIGRPEPLRFGMRALPLVLFGIPWTAFALFWIAGAASFEIPDFQDGVDLFPLFGIPFVLIGLAMLGSPFWLARRALNIVYLVTNQRAIILEVGFSTLVRSFGPDRLDDIRRQQRSDGSGDLLFEMIREADRQMGLPRSDHGFLAIRDVKRVEDLVRQLNQKDAP